MKLLLTSRRTFKRSAAAHTAARLFIGARPVPGRSAHEHTRVPGVIRWLRNNRSRCAPGRRALRSAELRFGGPTRIEAWHSIGIFLT